MNTEGTGPINVTNHPTNDPVSVLEHEGGVMQTRRTWDVRGCLVRVLRETLVLAVLYLTAAGSAAQLAGDTPDFTNAEAKKIEKSLVDIPVVTDGVLNVYFHVIYSGSGTSGDVLDSQIAAQLDVLNIAFASTGWSFILAGTDRTDNATWFTMSPGSTAEAQAKAALRLGSADDLNIYTVNLQGGSLGFTTWPWAYSQDPVRDGVMLLYSTLPGGAASPYNLGDTAVHMAGHWLGLYHTFQGSCGRGHGGDYVDDTPAEDIPGFGCPIGRDSCPQSPGQDPVQNFMDFSDDSCMIEFTSGQDERMDRVFSTFRYAR
jgi:Pregnancy-associated plasma protein-A